MTKAEIGGDAETYTQRRDRAMRRVIGSSDAEEAVIRRLITLEIARIPEGAGVQMSLTGEPSDGGYWALTVRHTAPEFNVASALSDLQVLSGYCYVDYQAGRYPDVMVVWVLPTQPGLSAQQSNYLPYPPVIDWDSVPTWTLRRD
jgi:hypothetical protein